MIRPHNKIKSLLSGFDIEPFVRGLWYYSLLWNGSDAMLSSTSFIPYAHYENPQSTPLPHYISIPIPLMFSP
jgi:hypothetical protein